MSDMGMPGGAPTPPENGYMGASTDPLKKNMSFFNPADLGLMKEEGFMQPGMKVKDVLMKIGIDPEGPAEQLVEFAKSQFGNADAIGKMNSIAQEPMPESPDGQGSAPVPPQPPEEASTPGLEGLMNI